MSLSATFTTGAILSMALAPLVNAVPSVTVVPLDGGCSAYPRYDASTGQAGPFLTSVNSTGTAIDGNNHATLTGYSSPGVVLGYITIPVDPEYSQAPFLCTDGVLQSFNPEHNGNDDAWLPLLAGTSDSQFASLGFGFVGTNSPILPYAHYVDGVDQGSVFLGAEGTTTWAFAYSDVGQIYSIRLLGPDNGGLRTGEVDGFLEVVFS